MSNQGPAWPGPQWQSDASGFQVPQFPPAPADPNAAGPWPTGVATPAGMLAGRGDPAAQTAASAGAGQHSAGGNQGAATGYAVPDQSGAVPQAHSVGTVGAPGAVGPGGSAVPAADVIETSTEIVVLVDMPGFEEDDIRIQADEESLIVTGERPDELDEGVRVHLRDRAASVQRRVDLPMAVDLDGATASHENGVCTVRLPKSGDDERRTIAFQ